MNCILRINEKWFCWAAAIFFVLPLQTQADTSNAVRKVIRQYALTSANDFPQRDPRDWRLLGSDDGQNWTVLDVRRDEVFSDRHQRRVFKIDNHTAYNIYRLEIDCVRNPNEANSVQLAEIEPLGETEDDVDPIPTTQDLVTAQGDHGPSESGFQAFDGRAETKWLDYSPQHPKTRSSWIQWQYINRSGIYITNVADLLKLRHGAKRGCPIQLAGVVAGYRAAKKTILFVDPTGWLDVQSGPDGAELGPGQRVILEGISAWTGKEASISEPKFILHGPARPENPRRIALEQQMDSDENLSWVEVEGYVRFCCPADNRFTLELEDNDKTISVQIVHGKPAEGAKLDGERVRVQGICQTLLDPGGKRVAGIIWAASFDAITRVSPVEEVSTNTAPLSPGELLAFNDTNVVLTEIDEIRRLNRSQLSQGPKVRLHAIATDSFGTFIQDNTGGIEVWLDSPVSRTLTFANEIEFEGVAGWEVGHGPVVHPEKITILGKGKLPAPQRPSYNLLMTGKLEDQWIECEAVVRATDGSHLLLDFDGEEMMATIRSAPAPRVERLVDATVRVRGVATIATDERGTRQGIHLIIPSLEYVQVETVPAQPFSLATRQIASLSERADANETAHRVKIKGVLTLTEKNKYFVQDATGGAMIIPKRAIVLTSRPGAANWLFWQTSTGDDDIATREGLDVGDEVEAVGFPETKSYSPILTEALLKKVNKAAVVTPVKVNVADVSAGRFDSTLVTLDATVVRDDFMGADWILALQSGQTMFRGFLPTNGYNVSILAPGSRVQVTGVCQIEPLPYAQLGKSLPSFALAIRAPGDIVVLARPPWWTLKHTLVLSAGFIFLLVMSFGWIRTLRGQVEQRTAQLKKEINERTVVQMELEEKKATLEKEIEERKRVEQEMDRVHQELLLTSREAGMADVATSVLHNVGNVLNSVNISSDLISEHIRNSKLEDVTRLAQLLKDQSGDLGHFLTQDERGKRIPGYLARLGDRLSKEQSFLLTALKSLTENVSHIKAIVVRQQDYANVSGVMELVSLTEVVNDALVMLRQAMERHGIKVTTDYASSPVMSIDRHKVLQILFNLLQNAKQACLDGGRSDKHVAVQIRETADGWISVRVMDNGVGIPSENLSRIFSQGFSTRQNGHGFGLHSSILMAQDMGASLAAMSDGIGCGSVFILDLPMAPKAAGAKEKRDEHAHTV